MQNSTIAHLSVRAALALTLLLVAACGSAPPPATARVEEPPPAAAQPAEVVPLGEASSRGDLPPPSTFRVGDYVDGEAFGGDSHGFPWWISADGRLVALYRFTERPTFDEHGTPNRPANLEVFDLRTNAIQHYDEIVARDPLDRRAIFREADQLWQLSTDSTERAEFAPGILDRDGDDNACMPPRQVSFDALGEYISWIRPNPDRIISRNIASGEEIEVQTPHGRLWRAAPTSLDQWLIMREVPRDTNRDRDITFPTQETTCACIFCERFASEPATFGPMVGDQVESYLAGPVRRFPIQGEVIPLGELAVGYPSERAIRRPDGERFPLPAECANPSFVEGVAAVILSCGATSKILYPSEERELIELAEPVAPLPVSLSMADADGNHWVAVLSGAGAVKHLSRLRMEDGRLEIGPTAIELAQRHYTGWVLARTASGAAAMHVGDGRVRTADVSGVSGVSGLTIERGGNGFVVVSPETGYAFETHVTPELVTANGCTLQPAHAEPPLEQGPWRLRCPKPL